MPCRTAHRITVRDGRRAVAARRSAPPAAAARTVSVVRAAVDAVVTGAVSQSAPVVGSRGVAGVAVPVLAGGVGVLRGAVGLLGDGLDHLLVGDALTGCFGVVGLAHRRSPSPWRTLTEA